MRSLLVFGILLSTNARALTWDACIQATVRNNADVAAARMTRNSTLAQEGVASSGYFPQLSGSLGFSKNNTQAVVGGDQKNGVYSASLNASQNLFNGLQDVGKVRQAKANSAAAEATYLTALAKASYDLKSAYEGLVYANNSVKLTTEIIKRRQENLRLVQLRFESGRENQGSVLLSQAYLKQAKYDDLQARNAQRTARAQLARALGLDRYDDLEIEGEIPVHQPLAARPDLAALATTTPDYVQARAQADAAGAGVTVARAAYFPTLSLTGALGEQGGNFVPHERDTWSLGLNLNVPIFSGGKDSANVRVASESAGSAEENRIATARSALAKLEAAWSSYGEGVEKLAVDESFRDAAAARAEIARKKYNNGLQTFDDWDLIENDLITRQKAALQSKRDRVLAEAAWEQAQGKGVLP